ncbi:MAG: hypothetical protein OEX19_13345, partial [Gammaproteobacteria bacterium]|nr:hypothetical protein [Gammaproteobacteria bacterium]
MNTKIFHLVPASGVSLWTFAILILFLIAMLIMFARFVYWSKYTTYEVSDQSLVINGGIWGQTLDREILLMDDA